MRFRVISSILVALSACVVCPAAWSYSSDGPDGGPHRKINELALKKFIVQSARDPFLSHYDFYPSEAKYGLSAPSGEYPFKVEFLTILPPGIMYEERISKPTKFPFMSAYIEEESVVKDFAWWVCEGGYTANEPSLSVALRHYYDPFCKAVNYPDQNGVDFLTDTLKPPVFSSIDTNRTINAVDWATTKSPYSWLEGQSAIKKALSFSPAASEKQAYYGKAWRSLGETMHILADLTVPAHVRNDVHLDSPVWGDRREDPYEAWVTEKNVIECAKSPLNPTFHIVIEYVVSVEELTKKVASLTNFGHFSADTISGTDAVNLQHIKNENKQPEYSTPQLVSNSFQPDKGGISGYYLDDGKYIAYRTKDGTHTVDHIVAAAQAKELIPAAIAANAKLISFYLPRVKVSVDSFSSKLRTAKCRAVTYKMGPTGAFVPDQTAENPSCGNKAVVFATFASGKKNYFLTMQKINGGKFVLDLSQVIADARRSPDKSGRCDTSCVIGLDMGGIVVKSDPFRVLSVKRVVHRPISKTKGPASGKR